MTDPLVSEATKKAAVAWVTVNGRPPRALWCMPADGALWVVSGPGEQSAPGLESALEALVTMRGDHGGRIVTWRARVTRVAPDSDQWAETVPQLAGKRLNAPVDAAALAARWADACAVHRLDLAGGPVEAGPDLPAGSLAEPPRESPARRVTGRALGTAARRKGLGARRN